MGQIQIKQVNGLQADLDSKVEANLYTADGSIAGARTVSLATNDLTFGTTGDSAMVKIDSTNDRFGIGVATVEEKFHTRGNALLDVADVTADSQLKSSPSFILRAKYDSNTASPAFTSANLDFKLNLVPTAGGASPTSRLDFKFVTRNILQIFDDGAAKTGRVVIGGGTPPNTLAGLTSRAPSAAGSAASLSLLANNLTETFMVNASGAFMSGNISNTSTGGGSSYLGVGASSTHFSWIRLGTDAAVSANAVARLRREAVTNAGYMAFYNGLGAITAKISGGDGHSYFTNVGNVGIGTAGPTEKLHVVGGARISSLAGGGSQMVTTDDDGVLGTAAIPAGADGNGIYDGSGNVNTATASILAGQRLTFGTTSTSRVSVGTAFGDATLNVRGTGASGNSPAFRVYSQTDALVFSVLNGGSTQIGQVATGVNTTFLGGSSQDMVKFSAGGAQPFAIIGNNASGQGYFELSFSNPVDTPKVLFHSNSAVHSYINSGANFGIGTTAPSAKLHVVGGDFLVNSAGATEFFLIDYSANRIGINNDVQAPKGTVDIKGADSLATSYSLVTQNGANLPTMRVSNLYTVGIGSGHTFVSTIDAGLHVKVLSGAVTMLAEVSSTNVNAVIKSLQSSSTLLRGSVVAENSGGSKIEIASYGSTYAINPTLADNQVIDYTNDLFYLNAGFIRASLTSAGNFGIGTAAPTEKLHVVGSILMNDGNQANGFVMTSDVNGVASWAAAAGGGGEDLDATLALGDFTGAHDMLFSKTGTAAATASQVGSQQLQFQMSLWDGAGMIEDIQTWDIKAIASTTVNQESRLAFILDGVTEKLTISSSSVGINNTAPTVALDVIGEAKFAIAAGDSVDVTNGTNNRVSLIIGVADYGAIRISDELNVDRVILRAKSDLQSEFLGAGIVNRVIYRLDNSAGVERGQMSIGADYGQITLRNTSNVQTIIMRGTGNVSFDTAGNFGIGTASPTQKLHVVGNSRTTGFAGFGGVVTPTANVHASRNSGNPALKVESAGVSIFEAGTSSQQINMFQGTVAYRQTGTTVIQQLNGVGTLAWDWRVGSATHLDMNVVAGVTRSYNNFVVYTGQGATDNGFVSSEDLILRGKYDSNGVTAGIVPLDYDATLVHTMITAGALPTSRLSFKMDGTEYLSLLNDGNFGIGTTAPSEKLHVAGGNNLFDVGVSGTFNVKTSTNNTLYATSGYATVGAVTRLNSATLSVNGVFSVSSTLYAGSAIIMSGDGNTTISKIGNKLLLKGVDGHQLQTQGINFLITDHDNNGGHNLNYLDSLLSIKGVGGVDTSSYVNIASNTLYVDAVGTQVGIGTALPSEKLHVVGSIRMVDGNQANGFIMTSDANGVASWAAAGGAADGDGIYDGSGSLAAATVVTQASFNLRFSTTGDANALAINASNGNVGIGTAGPLSQAHILSAGDFPLRVESTDSFSGIYISDSATTAFLGIAAQGDHLRLRTQNSDKLVIEPAGDIGIGTGSPSAKLHVIGSAKFGVGVYNDVASNPGGASDDYVSVTSSTIGETVGYHLGVSGARNSRAKFFMTDDDAAANRIWGLWQHYFGGGAAHFVIGNVVENFRITSVGQVGIGTAAPLSRLHIAQESAQGTHFIIESGQNAVAPPTIDMYFHRGTNAVPAAVAAQDSLGVINFSSHDGTNILQSSASISSKATEPHSTAGGGAHGASLSFKTTANLTAGPTISMFIDHNGNVGIDTESPTEQLHVVNNVRIQGKLGVGVVTANAGAEVHIGGSTAGGTGMLIESAINSPTSPAFFATYFHRGSLASPTYALLGDRLGGVDFNTLEGTNPWASAGIQVTATVAHASGIHGAKMEFSVAPNGGGNATVKMTLDDVGSLGLGTIAPNASAALDIQSTSKGVLMPRLTATAGSAVAGVNGLVIYVTSTNGTFTSIGFWGYEGGSWVKL